MAQYKDKNGHWYIVCTSPITHKKTTIRKNPLKHTNFQTKTEAKEYEFYFIHNKIDHNIRFGQFFEIYRNDYKRRNVSDYDIQSRYNTYFKQFENKKLINFTKKDIEKVALSMKENGCSISYINYMTTYFKSIMNFAVKEGYIPVNPFNGYEKIKEVKTSKNDKFLQYWTDSEIQTAIQSIPKCFDSTKTDITQIRHLILFAFFTGMRYGEIRGLKWCDINFEKRLIYIDRHINKKNVILDGRKNGDYHTLYIDDNTMVVLTEIKARYETKKEFNNKCYVFHSATRGLNYPLTTSTGNKYMKALAEYNHLPHIKFHGLRHSCASYLISVVGLNVYEVADRLGDTVKVTMSVYAELFNETKKNAATKMSQYKFDC